jgi:hypothetical protein
VATDAIGGQSEWREDVKIAVLLAAITIALQFAISYVAGRYGAKVGGRFLERGEAYTVKDINELTPAEARGYAFPVLFPLDISFMVSLGSFLGLASEGAAESISLFKNVAWLFTIVPALYVLADFLEDVLLAWMLLSKKARNQTTINLAQHLTKGKVVTCTFGIVQTILLSGGAYLAL